MDLRKGREDWVGQYGGFWNSTELALIWSFWPYVTHRKPDPVCHADTTCLMYVPVTCHPAALYLAPAYATAAPQNLSKPTHFTLSSSIQANYHVKRCFQICSFLSVGPRHCVLTRRSLPLWVHHALRKHPSHGICSITQNRKPSGSL